MTETWNSIRMSNPDEPNIIDTIIGTRVREVRIAAGLTEATCARALSCSIEQLAAYEAGDDRLRASQLFQLSQLAGVPLSTFFEGVPVMNDTGAPSDDPPTHKPH